MAKTHLLAICALVISTLTLGACSVRAQDSTSEAYTREESAVQPTSGAGKSSAPVVSAADADSAQAAVNAKPDGPVPAASRGYMMRAPADTVLASRLIGTTVRTLKDESVGSVKELIIDKSGQIVAIVVAVGGVLGMGEKYVAIGWDDVKRSGPADAQHLRIDADHQTLRSAPTFQKTE